ncbi:hypothetical protein [Thermotoga profunda]|uniref:hypothetical protein n=1 Tax=Thermotoga profunda TaxID=1508420 RepID=UPI000597E28C|nr:hypothetical protein [Thermotoga profunda]
MRRFVIHSSIILFLFISFTAQAYETRSIYIGSGYSRIFFNDGIICLVRSKPASVLVLTSDGKFVSDISIGLSYPVNAIHRSGMIFVSDYYKSSVLVYTIFGRLLKKITVGSYPTIIKSHKDKIYVVCSGDSSVYKIDAVSLEIQAKYTFHSASLYFEIFDNKLVFLYYFDTERTYEVVTEDRENTNFKIGNLRNPVRYFEKDGYTYILGYTDGIVVCLKDDKEMWRVNLSDFARDMVLTDDYIVVTSLLDSVATFVSYDGRVVRKIPLPNVTHKVCKIDDRLIFLNHLPGQVYIYDSKNGNVQTVEIGDYAIDMVQISQYEIAILCSDSGELYILSLM